MSYFTANLKCTKFDIRWGSTPDPAGELMPQTHSCMYGALLQGEGRKEGKRKGRGGRVRVI